MMSKKFIPAAAAAFIVLFLADWLWFGVLFAGMMPSSGPENIPMHALGELCLAVLMAWIYPMGYKGGPAMNEGLKFGTLIGLIYSLPGAIHMYASMGGSRRIPAMFVANGIIVGILAGITIAMIFAGKKEAAAAQA